MSRRKGLVAILILGVAGLLSVGIIFYAKSKAVAIPKHVVTGKDACRKDSDCIVEACSGPFSKEHAKQFGNAYLPCRVYQDYEPKCMESICAAVKY